MIGGDKAIVEHLDPIFSTLAPGRDAAPRLPGREKIGGTAEHGYLHCGPHGAGHFVKMVHNGIEYGVMAAYAEGLNIPHHANVGKAEHAVDAETTPLCDRELYQYDFDLRDIAELWRRGSVIASWLLDLTAAALLSDPSACPRSPDACPTPARGDGRSRPRSMRRCRRPCSPRRSTSASPRVTRRSSRTRCCRPCGIRSGAIRRQPRRDRLTVLHVALLR
jgi:hypothetical protein